MKRFDGKNVFISGGSKGIGLGCALKFADEGANVFLAASNVENLAAAKARIENAASQKVAIYFNRIMIMLRWFVNFLNLGAAVAAHCFQFIRM